MSISFWVCDNGMPTFKPPLTIYEGRIPNDIQDGFNCNQLNDIFIEVAGYTMGDDLHPEQVEESARQLSTWAIDEAVLGEHGCSKKEFNELVRMFEGYAARGARIRVEH